MIKKTRAIGEGSQGAGSGTVGKRMGAALMVAAVFLTLVQPVQAARPRARASQQAANRPTTRSSQPAGPATPSWILINAASGEELSKQDPDRPGAPASMTKMMLALLVMEAVRDGQLKLSDPVQASRLASKMGGSQVYLKEGENFPVEDMMAALLIGSGAVLVGWSS